MSTTEIYLVEEDGLEPGYESPAQMGQVIRLSQFTTVNEAGGTDDFPVVVEVKIIKMFWDYECGWRYRGTLRSDVEVDDPFEPGRVVTAGTVVFFSEFDIEGREDGEL